MKGSGEVSTALKAFLYGAVALTSATAVQATTYVGARNFSGEMVSISVTTNGVLGVVHSADISAWDIKISDDNGTGEINQNSLSGYVSVQGSYLTATATTLSFDFAPVQSAVGLVEFQLATRSQSPDLYLEGGSDPSIGFYSGPKERANSSTTGAPGVSTQSGVQVLATATAAPEPGAWALMILGSAGIGGALRRRRGGSGRPQSGQSAVS